MHRAQDSLLYKLKIERQLLSAACMATDTKLPFNQSIHLFVLS